MTGPAAQWGRLPDTRRLTSAPARRAARHAGMLGDVVVVLPALDEAPCVAETVGRWRRLRPLEVRVVDNGSADATAATAAAAGATVLSEPRRGYGAAAWRGVQRLPRACRWVIFGSADGSDRLGPDELRRWRRELDAGADLILGDRVTRAAARRNLERVQSTGNRLCCLLIRLGWAAASATWDRSAGSVATRWSGSRSAIAASAGTWRCRCARSSRGCESSRSPSTTTRAGPGAPRSRETSSDACVRARESSAPSGA